MNNFIFATGNKDPLGEHVMGRRYRILEKQNLYYLASPYSHPDASVQEERADLAAKGAAALKRLGLHIFAPIPHGHAIARHGLPGDFAYWQSYCHNLLDRCDGMIILTLDGWEDSIGVENETDYMLMHGKPVAHVALEDLI